MFGYAKGLLSALKPKAQIERVNASLVGIAADILGAQEYIDERVEQRIAELVERPATVQRLMDVIPEAFALVLISNMPETRNALLPNSFLVMDEAGDRIELPMWHEPIFHLAVSKARHTYNHGPRMTFKNNCDRSALVSALSAALDANASLEGAEFAPPLFAELPASLYV